MNPSTRLRQLLCIDLPIVQAPMAGAQGSALTVAVSNAGALGSLACGMLTRDAIRVELAAITRRTCKPFNTNFLCHAMPAADAAREPHWFALLSPYFDELGIDPRDVPSVSGPLPFDAQTADLLAEFQPRVVSFHFGLPAPDLLARVRRWNPKIVSTATTLEEAIWLEARGVDVVIAQGIEAGGHRGMFLSQDLGTQTGTMALVQQITRVVKCPVIAAGGISSADGIAAAMAMGAAGVQMGTAFLLCPEASITERHRVALKGAPAAPTTMTNLFTGRPARSIVNRLMRELGPMNDAVPAFPAAANAAALMRSAAERRGSSDFSPMWTGQNAAGCDEIPAAELVQRLGAAYVPDLQSASGVDPDPIKSHP